MRKRTFLPELIAPCGMNCRICIAFSGYTMKGEKRKHHCSGCRSSDRNSLSRARCAFIKKHCNKLATGQIEYCFECTAFPCTHLKTLDNRYRRKYQMSLIENLHQIQTQGIQQFLKNEQEKWKCPNCGGIVCVHNKTCYTCRQITLR